MLHYIIVSRTERESLSWTRTIGDVSQLLLWVGQHIKSASIQYLQVMPHLKTKTAGHMWCDFTWRWGRLKEQDRPLGLNDDMCDFIFVK